ncbi:hypothetical protein [Saccharopolyspora cebuensis]|uniref:Uncharacterized protein n=1 Tax=Saccharopolyspora cebuensis TaxID=418759 RepID=A0ABV4CQD8_9PSEU
MAVQHAGSGPVQAPAEEHDTTRHLSAAVHVDEVFADALIEECLAEPTRAIPPSPGIDPVAVLAEALAGRRTRVLRDSVLLGLFGLALLTNFPLVLGWAVVGGFGYGTYRALRRLGGRDRLRPGATVLVGVLSGQLVLAVLVLSLLITTLAYLDGAAFGAAVVGTLAALAVAAMLGVDRFQVRALLRDRFAPEKYPAQGPAIPWPPAPDAWYAPRLGLIAATANRSNVLVHDGFDPFVGSGELAHAWSIAIQLRPAGSATPTPLTAGAILEKVRTEIADLAHPGTLAPGGRFSGLQHSEEYLTSATSLLRHGREPAGTVVLPDPEQPPRAWVDPDQPPVGAASEWLRPYQVFRVASWQQDLVVSSYLHVACDDRTLYLEWNACALNPIKEEYRYERMWLRGGGFALLSGLADAVAFPVTVPRRARTLFRAARDAAGWRRRTPDDPSRYGARFSVRELAADEHRHTYLQEVDGLRYTKLMERRTLAAVDHVLAEHGLETEEFANQATTVVQSTVINGGQFSGTTVVGQDNTTRVDKGKEQRREQR